MLSCAHWLHGLNCMFTPEEIHVHCTVYRENKWWSPTPYTPYTLLRMGNYKEKKLSGYILVKKAGKELEPTGREAVAGCQGICLVIDPDVASCYCCFLGQETLLPLPQPPSCKIGKYCSIVFQGTAEKQLL